MSLGWWVLVGVGVGVVLVAYVALVATFGERAEVQPARAVRPPREPVTLRQAAAREVVPLSLEALRRAAHRDPRFPPPIGFGPRSAGLYTPISLIEWHGNRPGTPTRLRPHRSTVDHRETVAQRRRGEDERARRRNRLLVVDAGR